MSGNVFLSLDHGPFLSLSAVVKADDGVTRGTFRKEIIAVGKYVQRDQGVQFEVTPDTIKHWIAMFHTMQKNGVKVPIPLGHVETAEANRGWVTDLFTDGKSLVMTCELFDKDVENLVKRNDVSLCSPPEWTDGKGNRYVRPIRHIALTPVPVVPGLSDFVPIAASFGDIDMTLDLKQLGADIGIEKELHEKNAAALILDFCKGLKDQVETATGKTTALSKELEAAKKEPTPDKKVRVEVDPTLLSLTHDNYSMKLDALVAAAKITPAARDKLATGFIGENNAALKLSLETGIAKQFDMVVAALKENDPVKLGEQTGAQTKLELSDPNKGVDADVLVKDAERRAKAAVGRAQLNS